MQGFDANAQGILAVTARALKERLLRFFPLPYFALELMPAAMTPTVWKLLSQHTPFVGIALQGIDVPESAGTNPVVTQRWQLQLVVKAGTPELRLLGDSRSPGVVNMAAVAMLALHCFAIDDIGTVFCGSAVSLGGQYLQDNQAVFGIPLSISTTLIADEAVAALPDFSGLDIIWDFTPQLPDAPAATPLTGTDTFDLTLES